MKYIKVLLLVSVMVVASLVFAVPAFAGSGINQVSSPSPMDLTAFLQWLIGGGGSILAVSWILERMKWFQALTSDEKDYTIFGFGVVVGCGALAVVMYVPAAVLDAIAPFFLIVASTFVTVFIAKLFHSTDKVGGGS